jgi:hypothetical protein
VKRALYLATALFMPGGLIAVPLFWWFERRKAQTKERTTRCVSAFIGDIGSSLPHAKSVRCEILALSGTRKPHPASYERLLLRSATVRNGSRPCENGLRAR